MTAALAVDYTCGGCGATTGAVVEGLTPPERYVSDPRFHADREMMDRLLRSSAEDELLYATCPRCGARNPDGIARLRASLTKSRVIGAVVFLVLAGVVVVWRPAAFAALLLPIVEGGVLLAMVRPPPLGRVALNVLLILVVGALGYALPLAIAGLSVVQAVRFAVHGSVEKDGRWQQSAERVRFRGDGYR